MSNNATTIRPPQTQPADPYVWEARDRYFDTYGLGDGGYEDDWVKFKFGWIPVILPNTAGRKREIRAHDLHHVATGHNAVWKQGEIDVTAYELRSGGPGGFLFGWAIMLPVFALGLFVRPRAMFRAFVRARGSKNLFGTRVDEDIYSLRVSELRERLNIHMGPVEANGRDVLAFIAWSALALGAVGAGLAVAALLVLLGISLL